ncbi:hypothetical protein RUM43_013937 [Polyplax serrata]|uniref:Uncharacterized protein n=1 Tax=Polyplax serrata TaxID=468196 RepID=A0AAN8S9L7_POLSC
MGMTNGWQKLKLRSRLKEALTGRKLQQSNHLGKLSKKKGEEKETPGVEPLKTGRVIRGKYFTWKMAKLEKNPQAREDPKSCTPELILHGAIKRQLKSYISRTLPTADLRLEMSLENSRHRKFSLRESGDQTLEGFVWKKAIWEFTKM